VELKPRDRIVQLKILYYGPAVGGKTTNLQALHAAALQRHRGEFITVNSQQDRTILFDLLPLRGVGFHGFDIRFQLVAVPGQAPYVMARKLVTRGTDAVVFVANSALDRLQENVASLQEMNGHLSTNGIDPAEVPVVFQYNKRDLRDVLSVEELNVALNRRGAPWVEAVAVRGGGVLETLGTVLEKTMEQLTTKYRSLALDPGETVQAWAWGTLQQMFGATSLAGRDGLSMEASDEGRRRVQVPVPRLPAGASEQAKHEGLVDSYVRASMELSESLDRMREERDELHRRAEEMELTLRAIEALGEGEGEAAGATLMATLTHLTAGASCARGSLILPASALRLRSVAVVGMDADPFLASAETFQVAKQRFTGLRKPQLVIPAESPEVAGVLAGVEPKVSALAVAPVRSGFGLHALAMFYFSPTDPLPSPAVLGQIGLMTRALAAWFVVHRGRSVEASAEAARQTLPELERVVSLAAQLVRAALKDPEMARAHLDQAARTLEGVAWLSAALQSGDPTARKR